MTIVVMMEIMYKYKVKAMSVSFSHDTLTSKHITWKSKEMI